MISSSIRIKNVYINLRRVTTISIIEDAVVFYFGNSSRMFTTRPEVDVTVTEKELDAIKNFLKESFECVEII